MTLATTPLAMRRAAASPADAQLAPAEVVQTLCAVVAFVGLGFALMHSGGRDQGSAEIAMAMAAPSLVVGRVWRTLPTVELAIAAIVAAAAVAVPLLTPLGVSAIRDLNTYLYAAVLYLAVRSYACNAERRRLVAVALLSIAIVESLDVWRVWIGEHNRHFQVVGTFYWHNQFGAYAASIALFAACMAMRSRQVEDAIAWLVAPLFAALAVMSQSRGALLSLTIAGMAVVTVSIIRHHWWALMRLALVAGLAVAVHVGFAAAATSSLGGANPKVSGADYSPARNSLASTSVFRVSAGEEAAKVFAKAPLLSHGYGSLSVLGWRDVPDGATTSPYAHSAELQAAVDGGLLLGTPVALAFALMAWTSLRRIVQQAAAREGPTDWIRLGGAVAALALLLHTSMDFDSQYPALTALLVVAVAVAAPPLQATGTARNRVALGRAAFGMLIVAGALGGLMVASYWQTTHRLGWAAASLSSDSAKSVSLAGQALDQHRFRDPRPATFIVEATDLGYVFDDSTLSRALHDSRTYARLDRNFAAVWQRVNAAEQKLSTPTTIAGG